MEPAKITGIAMRVAVVICFSVGIALIVFGCKLQNPPKGYAPGMFVAAGSLNLFASAAGFWGSYNKKRILLIFIIIGGVSLLLQSIFIITLHTAFESVVDAVHDYSGKQIEARADVAKQLNVFRWVALGFLFVELLTLILACVLKWAFKEDVAYHGFDEDANEARMLGMGALRSDLEQGAKKNTRAYDKIKTQMAMKYGSALGAASDWKKKVQISFGNGRG